MDIYEIRVKGYLSADWSDWFDHLTIANTENGEAIISGPIRDQAELHGILARVHALNLPLLAVSRIERDVDDTARRTESIEARSES
jgi:hypothetical protein